jgi:hypothetical protein
MGYDLPAGGPRPVAGYEVPTAGAAAYSTPGTWSPVAALLNGGANKPGSVPKPESLATMFAPVSARSTHTGPGLAFFRGNTGGHRGARRRDNFPGFGMRLM